MKGQAVWIKRNETIGKKTDQEKGKEKRKFRGGELNAKSPNISYACQLILVLRNGSDKNDSNNGNEHVGMQKGANFSIVCTYFWLA